jgi:cytochrome b
MPYSSIDISNLRQIAAYTIVSTSCQQENAMNKAANVIMFAISMFLFILIVTGYVAKTSHHVKTDVHDANGNLVSHERE